jgi:hypothetical protein
MNNTAIVDFYPEINYEKSIKRHRLIYKITFWRVVKVIIDSFLFLVLIGLLSIPIFRIVKGLPTPIGIVGCSALLICWMISNALLNNTFIKIKGKKLDDNKKDILSTLNEFFSNYDFKVNNEKMMRSFTPQGNPIWGRIITILFNENDMYLNITSLGKTNSPTIVHGLINYIKAKRIAGYYKKHYFSN